MIDLPYKKFPFETDGSDLETKTIVSTNNFRHEITLISGVKTDDDVMRGEEIQLVGCAMSEKNDEQLFIHPGTHSKHVAVKNGSAITLKTYMTGEFFSLLSEKSILSASIERDGDLTSGNNQKYFEQGVKDGACTNLLHKVFKIRTNDLFQKSTKQENAFYLSGLLIGYELKDFPETFSGTIILAGESVLVKHYEAAMNLLGISKNVSDIQVKNADDVTLKGQFKVFRQTQKAIP
jgi:2-dehydro-3-deoxygalactonokinase